MKRRFLGAAIAVMVAIVTASTAFAADSPYAHLKWRSIGPAVSGGRVASVAGTPQDVNLYYVGTAGGGVWKSENGGATWNPVFEKQPVSAIGSVAIDPTNENVVWVGTGEANPRNDVSYGNGVYKSVDGGKTWMNVGLEGTRHISRVRIDPKNPDHVVVGALGDVFADSVDRGVYVTFDGGKTWTKSLYVGPKSGASDVAMDPNDPNVIYAGIWQFQRQPWTFHSGGDDDGLYKSTDGGKTWARLTGHGLPDGITGRIGLAIAPSDSNRIYALIEAKSGILWRSDDAGATWTLTSSDTLVDQRPFYFSHIDVDPKNADHVYAVSEMLAESKDGGKKFREIAQGVHVDYHAIWIAPNDSKRIMVGEDGGYSLTVDGGRNWSFSRNLPIGQIYHVGLSMGENPYWVCAPLQDNNAFCGPENSRNRAGILDEDWRNVVGGDGMWGVPDPGNANHIFADSQTGNITDYDRANQTRRGIAPYRDFSRSEFALANRKYRFNWDSPIAFSPWKPHLLWLGGDVVFQSADHGRHWKVISPDLTLNEKSHQIAAGGPLALDVSSAEFSDTILDIEGSPAREGEIWVGTDDGLVQLTLDGGKHWHRAGPNAPPYGRVETVAPSALDPATAYTLIDRHRSGDYAPYLFVTHDYGKTWTKIVAGLPTNQYVRTVRPDNRNRNLVFAGTENGMWISYDGGANWSDFKLNLPTVSVRDIREQPEFNDLVIATHGRALWVLDDLASLQQLPQARAQGSMLFAPRTAYQYLTHSNDEGVYTRFTGQNPPGGAVIDFYQSAPQTTAPSMEILDAHGTVIRKIAAAPTPRPHAAEHATGAATEDEGDDQPDPRRANGVTNLAGINRVVWNFTTDGGVLWNGAAKPQYRGSPFGPAVIPGTYMARMTLNGHTYTQRFDVKADPQSPFSQQEYVASHRFALKYARVAGDINAILNDLDAQKKSLQTAHDALVKSGGNTTLLARVDAAMKMHDAVFSVFTADYHNDEDSIQRPGALREDVPGGFGGGAPSEASLDYAKRFDAEYHTALAQYNAYLDGTLRPLSQALKASGQDPIGGINVARLR